MWQETVMVLIWCFVEPIIKQLIQAAGEHAGKQLIQKVKEELQERLDEIKSVVVQKRDPAVVWKSLRRLRGAAQAAESILGDRRGSGSSILPPVGSFFEGVESLVQKEHVKPTDPTLLDLQKSVRSASHPRQLVAPSQKAPSSRCEIKSLVVVDPERMSIRGDPTAVMKSLLRLTGAARANESTMGGHRTTGRAMDFSVDYFNKSLAGKTELSQPHQSVPASHKAPSIILERSIIRQQGHIAPVESLFHKQNARLLEPVKVNPLLRTGKSILQLEESLPTFTRGATGSPSSLTSTGHRTPGSASLLPSTPTRRAPESSHLRQLVAAPQKAPRILVKSILQQGHIASSRRSY